MRSMRPRYRRGASNARTRTPARINPGPDNNSNNLDSLSVGCRLGIGACSETSSSRFSETMFERLCLQTPQVYS